LGGGGIKNKLMKESFGVPLTVKRCLIISVVSVEW
jgi:hypothetical protein